LRALGRPKPVPRLPFVLTNGLKISSRMSGGTPGPLSLTRISANPSVTWTATATRGSGTSATASTALPTTFSTAR
jgi:hypothetical protein